MTGWIVLAVVIAGFIGTYRAAYKLLDEHEGSERDDASDRATYAVLALLIACMWPLAFTGWVIWRIATPQTARQKRAELKAMERRRTELQNDIRKAERQLGIKEQL